MSGQAINSIATILKRLEAATSRLEDIAASSYSSSPSAAAPAATPPANTAAAGAGQRSVSGLSAVPEVPPVVVEEDPPAVTAWDETVVPAVKDFEEKSGKIGGLVTEQAQQVVATFTAQRALIKLAANCAKPSGGLSSPVFAELLKPLQTPLIAVTEIKEKNRAERVLFNHLTAVAEGIPAVGWVAVEPKPGPFVNENKDSAQFYTNRVIKEFKEKDPSHVEWCRAFIKIFDVLREYIKQHHTTGLSWNPKGGDAASYKDTAGLAASAIPAPPPPPPAPVFDGGAPPPPPPPPAGALGTSNGGTAGGMGAVFSQLNQGEGVTKGLKKVDASQMTHKNPSLRGAAAAVPAPAEGPSARPAPPKPGAKPAALRQKKPAKTALEGTKWVIENHEDNRNIVIDAAELNHTVNIYGCKNTVVQIKGKINAVAMMSCSKTSVLLDSLVSALEVTSSPSFAVQVTGRTPTILLDSCDSGQVYLSPQGLDTEIVVAKCSAINVSIPKAGGEEGEFVEVPLPEQLRFGIKNGKLQSEVVAHTG